MRIRRLSEGTINRIAAGEVIERPASVVKELVENALDAGATEIDVVFRGGGKSLIRVSDDGSGMAVEDLALAVERHATSKLNDDALINIHTLGFRGEALPSIGSVARLEIISRAEGEAHRLLVEAGRKSEVEPAARLRGTDVDVRDLFFATPARLKFLKSDRSETAEALDVVRRLALAHPAVGFSFTSEDRRWLDAPKNETRAGRVARILGAEFVENATGVLHHGEDLVVEGFAGLPSYSRAQGTQQFAFVNGDHLPSGRFPAVVVFITCDSQRVDVNVHPAKTEVRFRDQGFVRGLIVSALRRALALREVQPNTGLGREAAAAFRPSWRPQNTQGQGFGGGFSESSQPFFAMRTAMQAPVVADESQVADYPLGVARAQLHGNYIVAQTSTGMILVDQHAAHERLVYERLKREREGHGIAVQPLLVPQVIELDAVSIAALLSVAGLLAKAGLALEGFGEGAVLVREVPAALGQADVAALLRNVADDVQALDHLETIDERLNHVLATFACHHSVRSGRVLRGEEMNALLREMEITPNSGACNHGRPTFISLSLADIERLFGRR
jgi:DNA mismatch repair protein MutL